MINSLFNKIKDSFSKKSAVYETFYAGLFYFWWFRFYEGVNLQDSLYKALLFAVAMLILRPFVELLFEQIKKIRKNTK